MREGSPGSLTVTGPVTLPQIARWRDEISARFAQGEALTLDLADSGPWDVAGLQLLLSAASSSARAGRPLRLSRVPNVLLAIAERSALLGRLSPHFEG